MMLSDRSAHTACPRYLIGPGDTPVILQEGFRYNALHVAVKNNRKEMCQVIIDTLES